MESLRNDAQKSPISHIAIVSLMAIGLTAIPLHLLLGLIVEDATTLTLLSQMILRIALSLFAIYLVFDYKFFRAFKLKVSLKGLVMVIPAFLVVINNIPIIALITGNVQITASTLNVVLFVFYCFSIGLYEEVVFRGIVFPLCLMATKNKKHGVFWAMAISSAIFALGHIMALLSGASIVSTLLQIGYSFLIGAMCAIVVYITHNLTIAIVLHTIFDIGGLMTTFIAVGNQWDLATIIITAVLGVIVTAYMFIVAIKSKSDKINPLYFIS